MIHTLEHIIAEHEFFRGLADRHIRFITGCAMNTRFEKGHAIFREGEEAHQFYLVREGLVAIELAVPDEGFTTLQTAGPNEVLGWSWLFPPYRWRFGARATEPTLALVFDGKCLRAKCEKDHELGHELFKRFTYVIAQRLEAARAQLVGMHAVHP